MSSRNRTMYAPETRAGDQSVHLVAPCDRTPQPSSSPGCAGTAGTATRDPLCTLGARTKLISSACSPCVVRPARSVADVASPTRRPRRPDRSAPGSRSPPLPPRVRSPSDSPLRRGLLSPLLATPPNNDATPPHGLRSRSGHAGAQRSPSLRVESVFPASGLATVSPAPSASGKPHHASTCPKPQPTIKCACR